MLGHDHLTRVAGSAQVGMSLSLGYGGGFPVGSHPMTDQEADI